MNYLLPVVAQAGTAPAMEDSALPLAALASTAPIGIVLRDACREDPRGVGGLGQGRSAVASAVVVDAPKPGLGRAGRADGVLFGFFAAPDEEAGDGAVQTSPIPESLLRKFAMPGIEVRTALTLLQQDDCDRSRGKRLPYIESGLPKLFFATGVGGWNRLLMSADLVSKERSARLQALVLSAECFLRLI